MIFGSLDHPETFDFLCRNPAWAKAFSWLQNLSSEIPLGIHEIEDAIIYANVQRYETLPREQCRFESHLRYYDLQFCIDGGESIEWQLDTLLQPDGEYDSTTDLRFYRLGPAGSFVHMVPRRFVIFGPNDAHLPKISDGQHPRVFKLVIKVSREALAAP